AGGLRRRLARAGGDLELVARLERIRLRRAAVVGRWFDFAGAERAYAAAFRKAGLAREGEDEAAVAARVRRSAVRAQLLAALDDWAFAAGGRERRAGPAGGGGRAAPPRGRAPVPNPPGPARPAP